MLDRSVLAGAADQRRQTDQSRLDVDCIRRSSARDTVLRRFVLALVVKLGLQLGWTQAPSSLTKSRAGQYPRLAASRRAIATVTVSAVFGRRSCSI